MMFYVTYSFYSFDWQGQGARTSLTNFRVFLADGSQMNFNKDFETSYIGPSTYIDGVFSGRTNAESLTYSNNVYINQYNASDTGSVLGVGFGGA